MLDPVFPPPPLLTKLVQPLADALSLTTLPLHAHEVLIAFTLYHLINTRLSPAVSTWLFPDIYPHFNRKTKINWDVHVVSLCQSVLICALALWVLYVDEERSAMGWRERVWGYTGAGGMIQGLAAGYFLWDLMVSIANVNAFGWGMLAHALCALIVFSFGFVSPISLYIIFRVPIAHDETQRPFVNYYGPTFILYELSSPFLNFHWFFDKVNMTGSRAQLYNGLVLLASFFLCRLVWGTYQSLRVYQDVWAALQDPGPTFPTSGNTTLTQPAATQRALDSDDEVMRFAGTQVVPVWLAVTYLASNTVLNTLNFYWFGKMIEAVRKRFRGTETKRMASKKESTSVPSSKKAHEQKEEEGEANGDIDVIPAKMAPELDGSGIRTMMVEETAVRKRTR
ncbi:MAG: hypothetical protein M1833_002753 [Piccolia ochrophora]|nr:MAG: hypothetical protein M1833_002753 [Piccolia ochrophora]